MPDGSQVTRLATQAILDAESEFMDFARENYEPCEATARQALGELSSLALMAKEIAEFTRRLMEQRAGLEFALSFERNDRRVQLASDPESVADCITDAVYLGEGEAVLREYVRRAMRSEPAFVASRRVG